MSLNDFHLEEFLTKILDKINLKFTHLNEKIEMSTIEKPKLVLSLDDMKLQMSSRNTTSIFVNYGTSKKNKSKNAEKQRNVRSDRNCNFCKKPYTSSTHPLSKNARGLLVKKCLTRDLLKCFKCKNNNSPKGFIGHVQDSTECLNTNRHEYVVSNEFRSKKNESKSEEKDVAPIIKGTEKHFYPNNEKDANLKQARKIGLGLVENMILDIKLVEATPLGGIKPNKIFPLNKININEELSEFHFCDILLLVDSKNMLINDEHNNMYLSNIDNVDETAIKFSKSAHEAIFSLNSPNVVPKDLILIDSGGNRSIMRNIKNLKLTEVFNPPLKVPIMGTHGTQFMNIFGKGQVYLSSRCSKSNEIIRIPTNFTGYYSPEIPIDILCFYDLQNNEQVAVNLNIADPRIDLFSGKAQVKLKWVNKLPFLKVETLGNSTELYAHNSVFLEAFEDELLPEDTQIVKRNIRVLDGNYLHSWAAHRSWALKRLKDHITTPVKFAKTIKFDTECPICVAAKLRITHLNGEIAPVLKVNERVYCDILPKSKFPWLEVLGYVACIIFVDLFSACAMVFGLKNESSESVGNAMKEYIVYSSNSKIGNVCNFVADGGSALLSVKITTYLTSQYISIANSAPYRQQQNYAERKIQTLLNMHRSTFLQSGVPDACWLLVLNWCCVIDSLLPSQANPDYFSPYRMKMRVKPQLESWHFALFGCAMIMKKNVRPAISLKTCDAIFVGFTRTGSYGTVLAIKLESFLTKRFELVETSEFTLFPSYFPFMDKYNEDLRMLSSQHSSRFVGRNSILNEVDRVKLDNNTIVLKLPSMIQPFKSTPERVHTDLSYYASDLVIEERSDIHRHDVIGNCSEPVNQVDMNDDNQFKSGMFLTEANINLDLELKSDIIEDNENEIYQENLAQELNEMHSNAKRRVIETVLQDAPMSLNERSEDIICISDPTYLYLFNEILSDFDSHYVNTNNETTQFGSASASFLSDEINGLKIPKNIDAAMVDPEWAAAVKIEVDNQTRNNAYELTSFTDVPSGTILYRLHWVFAITRSGKKKARCCMLGNQQKVLLYDSTTFAPSISPAMLFILLIFALTFGLCVGHIDVVCAFLNSILRGPTTFVRIPKGFTEFLLYGKTHVFKMIKAVYGSRWAPASWNFDINEFLVTELGFKRSRLMKCMYYIYEKDRKILLILCVDDMAIAASKEHWEWIKTAIQAKFDITDKEVIEDFMGIEVKYKIDENGIPYYLVTCASYIKKLVKLLNWESKSEGNFAQGRNVETPHLPGRRYDKPDLTNENDIKSVARAKKLPFREVKGVLLYVANTVRFEMQWILGHLSSFDNAWTEEHFNALKRVVKYYYQSAQLGFRVNPLPIIDGIPQWNFIGYMDADLAGATQSNSIMSGQIYVENCMIKSWSKVISTTIRKEDEVLNELMINLIPDSTTKSETIALHYMCHMIMSYRLLVAELGMPCTKPSKIYCDCEPAVLIVNGFKDFDVSTRILAVKVEMIRQLIKLKCIEVIHISGKDNPSDVGTKPVKLVEFLKHIAFMYKDQYEKLKLSVKKNITSIFTTCSTYVGFNEANVDDDNGV